MKLIKKYYRLIASVLVVTFMVPVLVSGINTEASTLKSSLNSNIDRYGIEMDVDNLTVRLSKPTTRYMNAGDANNRDNGLSNYPAGTYYIYKSVNGSINISKTKDSPGSWINVRDLDKRIVQSSNTSSNSRTNGSTITLKNSVKVYSNAGDALNGKNAVTTYSKGTYYIYKTHNGAINISRKANSAGGWIKTSTADNASSTSSNKKPTTPTRKPSTKKPTNTQKNGNISNNKVVLSSRTPIYITAADALNGTNSNGSFAPKTYYIYKTYGDAINISSSANQPGGWINSKLLNAKNGNTKTTDKKKKSSSNVAGNKKQDLQAQGNKVVLPTSTKVYLTADNAVRGVNASGTFSAGSYYIYRVYGNAINISKNPNSAGGWIHATLARLDDTSNESINENTGSKGKQESKQFVLVLDPGHGAGIKHNRGGLLFNEGDQNFEFTNKIIEESKRYKNVVAKTTRKKNTDDPSYKERAQAGKGADLYVSIHSNASSPSVRGTEAWGSNKNSSKGHNFAKDLTSTWSSTMKTNDRGVRYSQKKGSYTRTAKKGAADTWFIYQGNEAKEKVLLESVFHTNIEDSKAYLNNQDVLAKKFMGLVAKHFGLVLK